MVRILVDTSSDFEPEELRQRNLEYIPMPIQFGEESLRDVEELSKDGFYLRLETQYPTTAQPSPAEFAAHFQAAKEAGDELVAIVMSSALSGTYQGACLAKEDVGYDKVYVVDSLHVTTGARVMTDYALSLRAQGRGGQEIAEAVRALRPRVKLYAAMNTLEYLYRGGRLSKTAASLGTLANIKPQIHISDEGKVVITGKSIGQKRAIDMLVERVEKAKLDPAFPLYSIYANDPKGRDMMFEALRAKGYEIAEKNSNNLGPTIGAHIGPGATGIVFVTAE